MKTMSKLTAGLSLIALLTTGVSLAGVDTETDKNGVILAGYDAVAYFTENQAVEGSAEFTAVHNDAIYYFSTAKHRDMFNKDPEAYAPQYGGFCAYGAALGKKFEVNGRAFEVVDGKLYVNKNEDVYETWDEDEAENIAAADNNWPGIKDVPAKDL